MQEYPLFPKAIRLFLYAGTAVASLASVPTIIKHIPKVMPQIMEDADPATEATAQASNSPAHAGTISIQPIGPQTALHRQAELDALRAKLGSTQPAH